MLLSLSSVAPDWWHERGFQVLVMGPICCIIGTALLINTILKIKKGKLRAYALGQGGKKETVWRQIEPFKFYCCLAPQTFLGLFLSISGLLLVVDYFLWYFNLVEWVGIE